MQCADVMKTGFASVAPEDTAELAAKRMRDINVGFLPVCDHEGRVLGTVTDRDIATRVAADDRMASSCLIRDIMTTEPVACRASDDLSRAEELMIAHQKSRMLVTTDDGILQGVFSLSDIAQFEGARRTGATVRDITSRETRW
jgi:CBS domain-containing protein